MDEALPDLQASPRQREAGMKCALIVGNSRYTDPILSQLHTPDADVRALANALRDRDIGGFDEVTPLVDGGQRDVNIAISDFFGARKPGDLALLYFSGHGVLDNHGELYLAAADTDARRPGATGIPAASVLRCMDDSRARQQVLILDCCHSGAFSQGSAKGAEQKAVTQATFVSHSGGAGRVVLTASDSMQSSWEGDRIMQQSELSLFTHFLLEGLQTGKADADGDGSITLNEWYDYAYERVIAQTRNQSPQIWTYRQQGDLVIAHNQFAQTGESPAQPAPAEIVVPPPAPRKRRRSTRKADEPAPVPKTTVRPEKKSTARFLRMRKCGVCGEFIVSETLSRHGYYSCKKCGKDFHISCVDIQGTSAKMPAGAAAWAMQIPGLKFRCKLCHGPVELSHDYEFGAG